MDGVQRPRAWPPVAAVNRPTSPLSKHLGPGPHPDGSPQSVHAGGQLTLFGDEPPAPAPRAEQLRFEVIEEQGNRWQEVVDRLNELVDDVDLNTPASSPEGRAALLADKYRTALTRGAPTQYNYSVSIQFDRLRGLGIEPPITVTEGDPEATAASARAYLRGLPAYADSADAHEQMVVINPDGSVLLDAIHVGHKRSVPNEVEYGDPTYVGTHMLHNHPESVPLSIGDMVVGVRRGSATIEAVHAEGESRMDFDWHAIADERERASVRKAVEDWMVTEYRRITEDRSMLFASEALREKVQYGSGHALATALAETLPGVVTYTDTSPRPDSRTMHPTYVDQMRRALQQMLRARGVRKSMGDAMPDHTDCMGDHLVGGFAKHLGPGDHPDGTPQTVHGKKGAGQPEPQAASGTPPAPQPEPEPQVEAIPDTPFDPDPPVPAPPGQSPLPEGHVRAYHWTTAENAEAIRREGFRMDAAEGRSYGEGNGVWFDVNQSAWGAMGDGRALIEVAIPETFEPVNGGFEGTFVLAHDVPAKHVMAVHEEWHARVRFFEESDLVEDVVAGEYDDMLDMPQYAKAIEHIKRRVRKHLGPGPHPDGSPQDVHAGGRTGGGVPLTLFDPDTLEVIEPAPNGGLPQGKSPTDPKQLALFDPDWSPVMSETEALDFVAGTKYPFPVAHTTNSAASKSIRQEGFRWGPELRAAGGYGGVWGEGIYLALDADTTAQYGGARVIDGDERYGGAPIRASHVFEGRTLIGYVKVDDPIVISTEQSSAIREIGWRGNPAAGVPAPVYEGRYGHSSAFSRGLAYQGGGVEAVAEFDRRMDRKITAHVDEMWDHEREKYIKRATRAGGTVYDGQEAFDAYYHDLSPAEDQPNKTKGQVRRESFTDMHAVTPIYDHHSEVLHDTLDSFGKDAIIIYEPNGPTMGPGGNQMIVWDAHKIALVDPWSDEDQSTVPPSEHFRRHWVKKHLQGQHDQREHGRKKVLKPIPYAEKFPRIARTEYDTSQWGREPVHREYLEGTEWGSGERAEAYTRWQNDHSAWIQRKMKVIRPQRDDLFSGLRRNRAYLIRYKSTWGVQTHTGYFTSRREFDSHRQAKLTFKDGGDLFLSHFEGVEDGWVEVYDLGVERETTGDITLSERRALNQRGTELAGLLRAGGLEDGSALPSRPEGAQSEQMDLWGNLVVTMEPEEVTPPRQMTIPLLTDEGFEEVAEKYGHDRAVQIRELAIELETKGSWTPDRVLAQDAEAKAVLKERFRYALHDWEVPDTGGYTTRLTSIQTRGDGLLSFEGEVLSPRGAPAGRFTRAVYWGSHPNPDGGDPIYAPYVQHSYWAMNAGHQGRGVGTKVLDRMVDTYVAHGFDNAQVSAGLTMGGYAWAALGFDWPSGPPYFTSVPNVTRQLGTISRNVRMGRGVSFSNTTIATDSIPQEEREALAEGFLEFARRYEEKRESGWVPTAAEFAAMGKDSGPILEHRVGGRAIRVHIGKLLMAGQSWSGRMTLPKIDKDHM